MLCLALVCLTLANEAAQPFYREKLAEMDEAVLQAIQKRELPGGVLWLERGEQRYVKAYGNRELPPQAEEMTADTIFDAASLTKVLATAPSVMVLVESGKIDLDAPAANYLASFGEHAKHKITIRQLLTHTSGLRPGLAGAGNGHDGVIAAACAESLVSEPGTVFRYSDINFIVLGEIVSRVSGKPLQDFAGDMIFRPLKMVDTGYLPSRSKLSRIAPTEGKLRGEVHDPTARRMGGVAGHAGVFTTATDLARFSRCFLNGGELDGVRILRAESVQMMCSVQTPAELQARRGLGWDIDSPYAGPRGKYFPIGSYGHTGWTGTSLWIDPFSKSFVILLSNRNHPDESGNVIALRRQLGTLAAESIRDFNFAYVPGALEPRALKEEPAELVTGQVLNGIDVLARQKFAPLKGLKVGLITNQTGADRARNLSIDLLHNAEGVQLVALFSPEHGIRGALDEKVSDSKDEKTGLPVFSLYGERRAPSPAQLANLDALVFDIQDIGCRFYTYISTMGNCLEAGAKNEKKIFILDRMNPINGVTVEGPVLKGQNSFTGWHNIPVRYGMTIGELARMFNDERGFGADLTVIQVEGWHREFYFDQTSLPWINPSPNMRSLTEAILYPGIGLLETTSVSVGRGTDTPFELVGAPYIDDRKLALELNRAGLPGVRFVPVVFTPKSSVFKGQLCKGVSILLTDRDKCNVVDVGLTIASTLQRSYAGEFGLDKFNRLLVHQETVEAIRGQKTLREMKQLWTADLDEFKSRRAEYLIYK